MADFDAAAVSAQYGPVAAQYAESFGDNLETQDFDRAVLASVLAGLPSDGLVLDAGCGPAQGAAFAEARGFAPIALDVTPEMLEVARTRVRAAAVRADLRALPFCGSSFDAVIAWFSLLHLPRVAMPATLSDLRRVLRPRGRLAIALQGGHRDVGSDSGAAWCEYEPTEIGMLLTAAGFTSVVTRTRPPRPHEYQATKVIASGVR